MAMLREGVSGDWIGTFKGHKGAVWECRLNQDATQAVTASGDFSAKIWDALTGECLTTFTHKHIVKTAHFSRDGKSLYTGGHEKKLRIYDLSKPDADPTELTGHNTAVSYLEVLGDSNLLVSSGSEKDARVWDVRTGSVVKSLATADALTCMSLSHDGTMITTTSGKTVTMWKSDTFEQLKQFEMPRDVDCVAYHPTAGKFCTGSDGELWLRVFDYQSGDEIACNKGHHGPVRSVAFTPDGSSYASGSEDGTIRIWEKQAAKTP